MKDLLQLCADVQDAFWEAAAHAHRDALPSLFQDAAVQWNGFSDRLFALLLQLDHTSPDARWKANPDRPWMNPADAGNLDDAAICAQCLKGLEIAQNELRKAATLGEPRVRSAVTDQLSTSLEQMAAIYSSTFDAGRRAV